MGHISYHDAHYMENRCNEALQYISGYDIKEDKYEILNQAVKELENTWNTTASKETIEKLKSQQKKLLEAIYYINVGIIKLKDASVYISGDDKEGIVPTACAKETSPTCSHSDTWI